MGSVGHGHEAEVNEDPQVGAALLTAMRQFLTEGTATDGLREPGATDDGESDEEVA